MGLQNNKSLGQHWLKDRAILDEIADEALCDVDLCIEIGPGLGTLTSSLLKRFKKVLAVEFDAKLAGNLPKSFPGKNLEVKNEDFLKFNLDDISEKYAVAGNIPYYITSPIIFRLLEAKNKPEKIALLIQKEVAERILEGPGRHTYLSLAVQNYAEVEPGIVVPKNYFTPPPKVDSATIILIPRKKPLVGDEVLRFAKQGFSNPRKKLIKNLPYDKEKLEAIFHKLMLDPNVRPSDLNHQDWQELLDNILKTV
ncbi:ribosomal RNA small subunit methyltransferase A [Candidatus Saccharibacteria bacterium]|nr:ribosomal RNA small subunit methyltransferase A [Candidatus Saccharibacteria bacterium]